MLIVGCSIAVPYGRVGPVFGLGLSFAASLFYGVVRSGGARVSIKRYIYLSFYVALVLLGGAMLSDFFVWHLDPGGGWDFNPLAYLILVTVGWSLFSIGYFTRRVAMTWV